MRFISIIIMAAALVLSVLVFFVVPRLIHRDPPPQTAEPVKSPGVEVMVAAHAVAAGSILKSDDLRWQHWPDDSLDGGYLVKEKGADAQKDAVGRVVLRGFENGEPVTQLRLLKPGDSGFLAAALKPGMRAESVKIDAVIGTAGFINPGDHVDVLLTEHFDINYATDGSNGDMRPTQKHVNSVVLEDVRILAIDQNVQDLDNKPKVGTTATLELDPEQSQKLALAASMGGLALALRSLVSNDEPPPPADQTPHMVHDYDVSPFLAALWHPRVRQQGVRVYHGAGR
jgi:pilus assembly protein CpaB